MTNERKSPLRVYISGPYSKPDPVANTAAAMEVWHGLRDLGYHPVCPHVTLLLHLKRQRDWEFWLKYDEEEIENCDVVLRLLGESRGADREVLYAVKLGIPVVFVDDDETPEYAITIWDNSRER